MAAAPGPGATLGDADGKPKGSLNPKRVIRCTSGARAAAHLRPSAAGLGHAIYIVLVPARALAGRQRALRRRWADAQCALLGAHWEPPLALSMGGQPRVDHLHLSWHCIYIFMCLSNALHQSTCKYVTSAALATQQP